MKQKEESNIKIKFDYFKNNLILNIFIYINYSITFSTTPIFFIMLLYHRYLYIYVLSDTIGRLLKIILKDNIFIPLIIIRYLFCIYLYIYFEENKIFTYAQLIILGLLSGSLTTIGYYIPIKKANKEEKISLLYYLKSGKYNIIHLLIEDEKNKID